MFCIARSVVRSAGYVRDNSPCASPISVWDETKGVGKGASSLNESFLRCFLGSGESTTNMTWDDFVGVLRP